MEYGGWLLEHITITAVDKKLDGDPVANHKFLAQRGVLLARKIENPSLRLSAALREELNIQEERVTGYVGQRPSSWNSQPMSDASGKRQRIESSNRSTMVLLCGVLMS